MAAKGDGKKQKEALKQRNVQKAQTVSREFISKRRLTQETELLPDRPRPVCSPGLLLPPLEEGMPVCASWPADKWFWWALCTSWVGWWCACRCDGFLSWSPLWHRPWSWPGTWWRRNETKEAAERDEVKTGAYQIKLEVKRCFSWSADEERSFS